MTTTILVFVLMLLGYVGVAAFLARYIKNKDDFYVMGESASTMLTVGTLAATYLSAVTLLGIAGVSYSEGPLVIATLGSFGAWIGTLIAIVYIGRKMKAMHCRTMMDFFDKRFNNKWVSVVALILMIVGLLGYGIIQLIGAGHVLAEITSIPFPMIIIMFTVALMLFCSLSGMYGVVYTDTMMFFTMLAISFFIAPTLIDKAGFDNMRNLSETLPGFWSLGGVNDRPLGWSISQFLVWILFFACTPALVSRVFPAKNDFVLLKTAVIGIFFAPAMQVLVFLAAGAMQVLQPGIEPVDRAMIVGFMEFTSPGVAGVGLAGLMASIMSTASTLFVLTGFALARDLYEKLFDREVSERKGVVLGRVSQAIVALIVCLFAIAQPAGVYWISIYAGAIFAVAWLPTIVASMEWQRMNAKAALACMLVGSGTFVIVGELARQNVITLPQHIDSLMISVVAGTVALIVAGLKYSPSAYELERFRELKSLSLSKATIAEFMKTSSGRQLLVKEYRRVWAIAIGFIVIAVVMWGFFFLKLGVN
ncbi:sodium:solute symporter family transporter [Oceanisphaera sp.]|uniref:sodium:solute symporter family transporter n=1 Tax=Oceanisphaera sp. TaxID=1929979 RepID=UPI003A8F1F03